MKKVLLGLIVVSLGLLLLVNVRPYQQRGHDTVFAQLRYLERALADGAAEDMQDMFPEGYVFTWALYGLSSARLSAELAPLDYRRASLLEQSRRALTAVRSERARSTFTPDLRPRYGAFYASWSLYVYAEYVRAVGSENISPVEQQQFTRECDEFAIALAADSTPFLETYADQVWPADTSPGVAALAIHDRVFGPRYRPLIHRWVAEVRKRVDPTYGAVTHEAEVGSGEPAGGVRGESLALMSRLLVDVDPIFSREQYAILREHFLDDVWSLPGIREYPHGVEGREDVDSGPIILGYSGPAVVVGAAAARVHGDKSVADGLMGSVELVGMPIQFAGRRYYAAGQLPVGDAFIAWARTSPRGEEMLRPKWSRVGSSWFMYFHIASLVLALGLLWCGWRIVQAQRRQVRAPRELQV